MQRFQSKRQKVSTLEGSGLCSAKKKKKKKNVNLTESIVMDLKGRIAQLTDKLVAENEQQIAASTEDSAMAQIRALRFDAKHLARAAGRGFPTKKKEKKRKGKRKGYRA
jgi:hypothetical protein